MNPENQQDPLQPQATPQPQPLQQPVMDIQRPAMPQQPSAPVQPEPVPQPFVSPQQDFQQQQFAPTQPQPDPMPNPNAQEVGAPNYEQQHVALNKQVNKKRRGIIIVIALAVLITIGLIGAAGYAYWQSRSANQPEQTTSTETVTDDGRVDATDIDETVTEIDNSLNSINDSEDFGTNDLSDDGIGL